MHNKPGRPIKNNGIVDESVLPYEGPTSSCQVPSNAERHYISSYNVIQEGWPLENAEKRDLIKQALTEKGPLIVDMSLRGSFDEHQIYRCDSPGSINHSAIITGYRDTGDVHTSYWEVRDSSGLTEEGYFKVGWDFSTTLYGFQDQCNITSYSPLYVSVSGETPESRLANAIKGLKILIRMNANQVRGTADCDWDGKVTLGDVICNLQKAAGLR